MKPLTAGFFNVSWAKVTYRSPEDKSLVSSWTVLCVTKQISNDVPMQYYAIQGIIPFHGQSVASDSTPSTQCDFDPVRISNLASAPCVPQTTCTTSFVMIRLSQRVVVQYVCSDLFPVVSIALHHLQSGYSSAPGIVHVVSYDVFSRKYEAHVVRNYLLYVV